MAVTVWGGREGSEVLSAGQKLGEDSWGNSLEYIERRIIFLNQGQMSVSVSKVSRWHV